MKVLRLVGASTLMVALIAAPVGAEGRTKPNLHFFSGTDSHSNWTPKESVDDNRMSIELHVAADGFAGAELLRVEGEPPVPEPSFWFKADRAGPSGGSPRLQVHFENGTIGDLRPLEWDTEWEKVGGNNEPDWDVRGGPCGFRFAATYEEVLTCAGGGPVTDAFLIGDSGWLHGEYTNWVDRLQWDGHVFSHASDNNNAGE